MVELARRALQGRPVTAQDLAKRCHIPDKYLVHILLQLKRAGLVRSVRGPQGGHLLARHADGITLLDVVQAIDGPILEPLPVQDGAGQELAPVWRAVSAGIAKALSSWTLRKIIEAGPRTPMYHI